MAARYFQGNIFDRIECDIISLFDGLMLQIIQRKEELIRELSFKRDLFEILARTQGENLSELQIMRNKLIQMSTKQTATKTAPKGATKYATQDSTSTFKSSLDAIEKQILDLRRNIPTLPNLIFDYSSFDFGHKICTLGSIIDPTEGQTESQGKESGGVFAKNTEGQVKLKTPTPEHLFTQKKWTYVCNEEKVIIYNPLNVFGKIEIPGLHPTSSVTYLNSCYVTFEGIKGFNYNSCVSKFHKGSLNLISSVTEVGLYRKKLKLNCPCGIAISCTELFVADSKNNRICVLDFNLNFKRQFGAKELQTPNCIQLNGEFVYVLNSNEWYLQVFNLSGTRIRCLLPVNTTPLNDPKNFSLDASGKIFITDFGVHTVKIFSPEGVLLRKIGTESLGTGIVSGCHGIVVFGGEVLVACKELNCIKSFKVK